MTNIFQVFSEIGAIDPLKRVACSTNHLASKLACRALRTIGETIPYELSPQVPLWEMLDVQRWINQVKYKFYFILSGFHRKSLLDLLVIHQLQVQSTDMFSRQGCRYKAFD